MIGRSRGQTSLEAAASSKSSVPSLGYGIYLEVRITGLPNMTVDADPMWRQSLHITEYSLLKAVRSKHNGNGDSSQMAGKLLRRL
jgi:hypothetical protein